MTNLVGVTGGMGAGKSRVLEELNTLGARTLDSDDIVHDLYDSPTPQLRNSLRERWSDKVLNADGSINRRYLAETAFRTKNEIAWLNAHVHPIVRNRLKTVANATSEYVFCAVPLLFEVGWEKDMGCTIAVWCDPRTQRERLRQRGWSTAEINRRQAYQMSMDEKLLRADFGLINNGSPALLQKQLERLMNRMSSLSQSDMPATVQDTRP